MVSRRGTDTSEGPFVENFDVLNIIGGHIFIDGSGDTEIKDPHLRRCGYDVTWILENDGILNALGDRAEILHGRTQFANRIELLTAIDVLLLCASH